MSASLCSILISDHVIDPDVASTSVEYLQILSNSSSGAGDVSLLNRITYAYIAPFIIAFGIIGDIMTVSTLTHPLLRRSHIIYTYLILLAMTDLLTHLSIIPMILLLLDFRLCSYSSALYYAHVGFPLVNALMGASVWIVVFLTVSQYMAVCHPFHYRYLRSRKMCFLLFAVAYVMNFCIYAPWAVKKSVFQVPRGITECEYVVCELKIEMWYKAYEWIREIISRILPFVAVAYFNSKILITYRINKKLRIRRLASNSQKNTICEKSEKEERRLFVLLFSIIIVFFVCTIPAAPLTIFVSDKRSKNLPFQIFRAITNVMEFTKFALNFYLYCLINPDIRRICFHMIRCKKIVKPARVKGQPVNPISLYARSSKSLLRESKNSVSSFRSPQFDDNANSTKGSVIGDTTVRSASFLANIIGGEDNGYERLMVIKENDDNNDENTNERTSML